MLRAKLERIKDLCCGFDTGTFGKIRETVLDAIELLERADLRARMQGASDACALLTGADRRREERRGKR